MQKKLLVNIDFTKRVYDNITNKNFVWCCDLLILKNYKEFEKILKREYLSMDNGIIVIDVVNSNDVEHFKYILDYVEIYDIERVLFYCLPKGLFNIVDYILNNNPEFDKYEKYIDESFMSNSLEFYNKYIKKCEDFNYGHHFRAIAKTGNINFVKKFINTYKYFEPEVLYEATKNGNIEVIKYLVENKDKLGPQEYVLYGAVLNGNIENIKYLLQKGYMFNEDIDGTESEFDEAIYKNNFEILDWLLEKGCKFGPETFSAAAVEGNLKIMKWLLKHGCKFNNRTFNKAIEYGNIKNLEWLVENGCKVTKNALHYNTSSNWKEVQAWGNNSRTTFVTPMVYLNNMLKYGNLDKIKEIEALINVYKITYVQYKNTLFKDLIKNNKLDIIKLLRGYRNEKKDSNAPVFLYPKETFHLAVRHGNIKIIQWLLLDGLEYKYEKGHLNVVDIMFPVNVVLRRQVKNILKDFLKENNIKIYKNI